MSNLTIVTTLLLVAILCTAAFAQDAKDQPKELANVELKDLPKGNTQFGLAMYAELAAKEKGNVFFSPFSISEALTMTYLGAGGDTKLEMRDVLKVPRDHLNQDKPLHWTNTELAAAYKELHAKLRTDKDSKFELHVANALWGAKDAVFKHDFLNAVDKQFGGKLTSVDFVDNQAAAKTINAWVEKQTRDKIKNLVPADALNAQTRLVLTNAIYFKAPWAHQFKSDFTKERDFFAGGEKKVQAKMMEQTARFRYNEVGGVKVLEMGYEKSPVAMAILLPEKKNGLAALEKSLAETPKEGAALDKYFKDMQHPKVHVMLPKFKFTCSFSLGEVLKKMGMTSAFEGNADFSGMSENEKLFISAVLHKAFVDVNEEGTEAAAATAVMMELTAMPQPEEPKQFVADHPFLFVIRDTQTGSVLFMGRVNDPTK